MSDYVRDPYKRAEELLAANTKMVEFNRILRNRIRQLSEVLRNYEAHHVAKGTKESLEKAEVNAGHVRENDMILEATSPS